MALDEQTENSARRLLEIFDLHYVSKRACPWHLGQLGPPDEHNEALRHEAARLLATEIVRYRTPPGTFELWSTAVKQQSKLTGKDHDKVAPFVVTVFGLPTKPGNPDHSQGYVAEFLWYLTALSRPVDGHQLRRIEGPKTHVTGPGGDGLTVQLRDSTGRLAFNIWEIKKHAARSEVSATVGRASSQLASKATEYLAELTSIAAAAGREDGQDVAEIYAELVNLWVDEDPRAGVAISVTTANPPPKRCFTGLPRKFARMTTPGQLQALLLSVIDFPQFALMVRDEIWTPL